MSGETGSGRVRPCASSGGCEAWRRDELGELSQVLRGGDEVELISGALGTAEPR